MEKTSLNNKWHLNKVGKWLTVATILVWLKSYQQERVNQDHASIDFAWKIDDLHTRDLLNYLVVSGEFDNGWFRKIDEYIWINPDVADDLNKTKNIFLWSKNYPDLDSKKEAVIDLRQKASSPILIHTDFEWGYVHSIDDLSSLDHKEFDIPSQIIALQKQEFKDNSGLSALPSAEYIGKEYEKIVLSKNYQKRLEFLQMMKQYGGSVAKMMKYIDVDVVYGPDGDIVDQFNKNNGDQSYIADNDRSFAQNFIIGQDLISSFTDGFQSEKTNILLVPKHFAGTGKSNNPHAVTDTSGMSTNDWDVKIFRNLINGKNLHLDEKHIKQCLKDTPNRWYVEYKKLLRNNLWFIAFLKTRWIDFVNSDPIWALMTTHISGKSSVLWSRWPITYTKEIIDLLKNPNSKILRSPYTKTKSLKNWIITTDDLSMNGASQALESLGIDPLAVNKIIMSLAAGHDMALYLETKPFKFWRDIDSIIDEVAQVIDKNVDLNHDWYPDLTKQDLRFKVRKVLDLMVKKWQLTHDEDDIYRLTDASYFDPSIVKVLRDSRLSNQWMITGASISDYRAEWQTRLQILQNKWKNLYETLAHNLPNAVYKYITSQETYQSALEAWKKLIIVDKSESTMFIFTVDGKKLLEYHPIWLWKWSGTHDYKDDRKVFGDNKTPVWYYMITGKLMWQDLYKEFSQSDIDDQEYYGWANGGMLKMIGPWTPFVAIHGATEKKLWPVSSACVRVIDELELKGKSDINEQKLIHHLAETIPVWSFVIITN